MIHSVRVLKLDGRYTDVLSLFDNDESQLDLFEESCEEEDSCA